MINSRDIDELLPRTADKCRDFIAACRDAGVDIIITSTYRDKECQNALYAQGRTKPGERVTNVASDNSFHAWRVAFDFVPLENGKPNWKNDDLWARCGDIAKQCGLEWGGSWTKFVDKPHCQDTGGYTIADFRLGQASFA
jgi:peptidoglycan L-alanyl-D-glutamate endopeptidase CwlK